MSSFIEELAEKFNNEIYTDAPGDVIEEAFVSALTEYQQRVEAMIKERKNSQSLLSSHTVTVEEADKLRFANNALDDILAGLNSL